MYIVNSGSLKAEEKKKAEEELERQRLEAEERLERQRRQLELEVKKEEAKQFAKGLQSSRLQLYEACAILYFYFRSEGL